MADRTFVVQISERALEQSIQAIGKKLQALDGQGLESGARSIDAVLHDLIRGVRDNVLLKTNLEPADLESLLRKNLGSDYKLCTVRWMG